MEQNKLFLICPFSNLEHFIRRIHGADVYFMTAMATAFNFDRETIKMTADFLDRKMITHIYVVNDTSCRFMNGVIDKKMSTGSDAEKYLEALFMENQKIIMKQSTILDKVKLLSEININKQISNFREDDSIMSLIKKNKIIIKGLITNKAAKTYMELNVEEYECGTFDRQHN